MFWYAGIQLQYLLYEENILLIHNKSNPLIKHSSNEVVLCQS